MMFFSKGFEDYLINFLTGFFGTPALLIGLFALIGCIIQRKTFTEIMISVFKTIIGFLIIGGGAGIISGSITKFGQAFLLLFGRDGMVANNDVMPGFFLSSEQLQWIATAGSLILIFGMLLNLMLARLSKLKYIYLTGHSAWYFSVMIASVLAIAGIPESEMWLVVLIGSILVSIWMVISPAMLQKHTNTITKTDNLALAHTGSIGYLVSGTIGEFIFKIRKGKVKSTESFNFPKGLAFLRNTNVSIALTMLFLFMVVYFTAWGVKGNDAMIAAGIVSASDSIFVQGLIQAFTFAAGVEVLLIGVRMFIAEITPAFKGISDKLIKDAKPAIDCPVVFPFAPNAVIIGFLASVVGGFIMFGVNIGVSSAISDPVLIASWGAIIIPSIVPHFFTGAAAGVYGNAKGGVWGAIIGAFINGIIISLVPWIFMGLQMLQPEITSKNVVWGDADFIVGLIPFVVIKYLGGKWVMLALVLIVWTVIPVSSVLVHKYKMNKNEAYKSEFVEVNSTRQLFGDSQKNRRLEHKTKLNEFKSIEDKKQRNIEVDSYVHTYNKESKKIQREHDKEINLIRKKYKETEKVATVEMVAE